MNTTLTGEQLRSNNEVEELVTTNTKLAFFFANMWSKYYGEQDALSDALLTLFNAARLWDGSIPFGSYASLMMKWNMGRRKTEMERSKRGGGKLDLSLDEMHEILGHDSGPWIANLVDERAQVPGHGATPDEIGVLCDMLDNLKPQAREVIERRYGIGREPQSLEQAGRDMQLTGERVRQIQRDALERLRLRAVRSGLVIEQEEA